MSIAASQLGFKLSRRNSQDGSPGWVTSTWKLERTDVPERITSSYPWLAQRHRAFLCGGARVGFLVPDNRYTEDAGPFWQEIERQQIILRNANEALVRLARRVAGWVMRKIVHEVAVPEVYYPGREVPDRKQVGRAVREVMGQSWFVTPCGRNGRLRRWTASNVFDYGTEIEVNGDGKFEVHCPGPRLRNAEDGT